MRQPRAVTQTVSDCYTCRRGPSCNRGAAARAQEKLPAGDRVICKTMRFVFFQLKVHKKRFQIDLLLIGNSLKRGG